jgi:hypothetical protein
MNAIDHNSTDPFILLSDLARHPGVTRTALELAIRTKKLTVISRFGKYWVHRLDAKDWLAWRASIANRSEPIHQLEL